MQRWSRYGVAAALILNGGLLCGMASAVEPRLPTTRPAIQHAPATAPADPVRITCDAPFHDFGSVRQGTTLRHEFVIRNVSQEPVRLTSLPGSAFGIAIDAGFVPQVAPAQTTKVPVVVGSVLPASVYEVA